MIFSSQPGNVPMYYLTEFAKSCAHSVSSCGLMIEALSIHPCPKSPKTARNTTRVIAIPCADRAAIQEIPDASQSGRFSVPAPCQSCASISPAETRSSSAPSPLLRPASRQALQSVSSVAPASACFLSPSYRNSSPVSKARWTSPFFPVTPANRATRPRLSNRNAAATSRLSHP
jgi:hypothetical protein